MSGWQGSIENYTTLLTSSEKTAVKYVDTQLSGGRGMISGLALSTISQVSPVAYAPILDQFLENRRSNRRREAAIGMWRMAPSKSKKLILKQLKREKDDATRAWLLRAAEASTAATAAREADAARNARRAELALARRGRGGRGQSNTGKAPGPRRCNRPRALRC